LEHFVLSFAQQQLSPEKFANVPPRIRLSHFSPHPTVQQIEPALTVRFAPRQRSDELVFLSAAATAHILRSLETHTTGGQKELRLLLHTTGGQKELRLLLLFKCVQM
jgi:hypothetical protein